MATGGLWMADNRLMGSDSKESYLRAVEFSAEGQGLKWSLEMETDAGHFNNYANKHAKSAPVHLACVAKTLLD